MNTSAPIAEPLLRQACGLAPRILHVLLGTDAFLFFMRLSLSEGHWTLRAGLATRLRDFATNRHE